MNDLEARYRRLFSAYPEHYRDAHEDEMVSTLLDIARRGQRRPDVRQAVAIVFAGTACRFRSADEVQRGLRLAGVVATALVAMMATAAIGVVTLPPLDPNAPQQLVAWGAVIIAAALGGWSEWGGRRFVPPVGIAALAIVAGSDLMGMRRIYVLPAMVLLVMSTLAGACSMRTRTLAVGVGALAGGGLVVHFVDRTRIGWSDGEIPWQALPRWSLAADIVPLPAWVYVAGLAGSLLLGFFRPRFAVAAAVLAVPIGLLTANLGGTQDVELYVVLACVVSPAAVLAAGLVRGSSSGRRTREAS